MDNYDAAVAELDNEVPDDMLMDDMIMDDIRCDLRQERQSAERLVPDPQDPMTSAEAYVDVYHTEKDERILHHRAGDFFRWTGTHYRDMDERGVRAGLWQFLAKSLKEDSEGNIGPFNPNRHKVTDVLDALRAVTHLDRDYESPCWLQGHNKPDPAEIMPCKNGLLHLPSETLYPATPNFFGLNALPFSYDPKAPEPAQWLKFLQEDLWPGDEQSLSLIHI